MILALLNSDNYTLTVHAASSMLVGIAVLALGFYVLAKERGSRIGLVFWFFTLCISLWLVGFGAVYASLQKEQALWWVKFSQIGVTFIPFAILLLVLTVVQRTRQQRKLIRFSITASTIFCIGVVFTNLHVQGLYRYFWGYYPEYGPLGVLFLLYFFSLMIYVLRFYWVEYRSSTSDRLRKRLKGLLLAFSIAYLASLDFLAAFGVPLYPFGYVCLIPFLLITAHVIRRYRLIDITPELAAGQILETMQGAVIVVDLEGRVQVVNRAAEVMLGHQKSDLLGNNLSLLLNFPEDIMIDMKGGVPGVVPHETVWPNRDGKHVVVSVSASVVKDRENSPIGVVYVAHDITERKQAEKALQESENKFRSLTEKSLVGIYVIQDEVFKYVNPTLAEIFGYSIDELINKKGPADVTVPEDFSTVKENLRKRQSGEAASVHYYFRGLKKNGSVVTVEVYGTRIMYDGQPAVIGTLLDITERQQAEEKLKNSEEFIRNILEAVDEGFIVIDRELKILSANNAFLKSVGATFDDVVGRHCHEITHKISKACFTVGEDCAVKHTFETGQPSAALHTHYDSAGKPTYVEIKSYPMRDASGCLISAIETITDITEKKTLEESLRQAQKMEAVGTLAGGIAHDFNNILAAIIGYSSLLQMKMKEDDPLRPNVKQIIESSNRAAQLTKGLLAFSRKQVIKMTPISLHEVVKRVETLLVRIIGEDISLDVKLDAADMGIMADSGQIEQVIINLATNARDAMPSGGSLYISTTRVELDEGFIKAHGYGKVGSYALISVTDGGCGIDATNIKNIFEPFYTTKEVGKGTGLGLAIVYGIVKQHNGFVNVYSEPGQGTTFKIYLPLINAAVNEPALTRFERVIGGSETILVAEDDEPLRNLVVKVLKEFGYNVLEARDGQEAVRKFEENLDDVALVILDVVMPKLNGKAAGNEIVKMKPRAKILFQSGYPMGGIQQQKLLDGMENFLYKPVSPQNLLKKVRELIDR
jgi:PAS domain S-box-containing protein